MLIPIDITQRVMMMVIAVPSLHRVVDSLRGDHVCELNPLDANDEGGAVSFRDFITDTTRILA